MIRSGVYKCYACRLSFLNPCGDDSPCRAENATCTSSTRLEPQNASSSGHGQLKIHLGRKALNQSVLHMCRHQPFLGGRGYVRLRTNLGVACINQECFLYQCITSKHIPTHLTTKQDLDKTPLWAKLEDWHTESIAYFPETCKPLDSHKTFPCEIGGLPFETRSVIESASVVSPFPSLNNHRLLACFARA